MSVTEKMKKLRHVVLHGVCDNQILSILGQNGTVLQYLDITGSADVTDLGIQNLVFPLAIQKAGRVNLVNTRSDFISVQDKDSLTLTDWMLWDSQNLYQEPSFLLNPI